jgi:hypothetical protein
MKISAKNSSFNEDPYLRESHNCYSYFLNLKDASAIQLCRKTYSKRNLCRRSQPGYASHYPSLETKDFNCPTIVKRTLSDNPNIYKINKNDTCGPDHYKGAIVVAPGRDYHYYRMNDEYVMDNGVKKRIWTHKPGYKPSTYVDANNKVITDPETASRNYGSLNYADFCTFVCVPGDPNKKKMRMYNDSDNNDPLRPIKKKLEKTVINMVKKRNAQVGGTRKNKKLNVKISNKV